MNPDRIFRIGAGVAIAGGGLRIAAAFIPYAPESPPLEILYAAIDVSLLFGLVAIFARESASLGWPGLAAFGVALTGLASIVGPDASTFGVDWYQIGAATAALGLAACGATLLAARRMITPALCWIAVPGIAALGGNAFAVQAAGVMFGLGFVLAGVGGLTQPAAGKG